jgi:hypothetical protein
MTMRRDSIYLISMLRRALAFAAAAMLIATAGSAQNVQANGGRWRISASVGGFVPFSALIKTTDSDDTRLEAGPASSLEAQFLASDYLSIYAAGMMAFPRIRLGSSIRPAVIGPSDQVMLAGGSAGLMLTSDFLGESIQPTLRLGGAFKWYSFDLTGTENQIRPAADLGIGFRGIGLGPIDVSAELRYLPSSFDQSKLPTRGITPQDQRQNDLMFSIGIGIRPG